MKIKIISDTHNQHDLHTDLECDLLIHSGDAGTKGNFTELEAFLKWFVKQPAKYKIFVPGNHDRHIKGKPQLQLLAREYGITVLMNEGITINGLKIWGGTYVPRVKDGLYIEGHDLGRRVLAWRHMPDELDLLITHAPPWGILDINKEGFHCGCNQLTEKVRNNNIKYHVFGHIHEDGGKSIEAWGTKFYNCAVKNREYLTVRNHTEINI